MSLTKNEKLSPWPEKHILFIEKIGQFQETAQKCWQELIALKNKVELENKIIGVVALYKVEPEMIYRAAFIVSEKPKSFIDGLRYDVFKGGNYLGYTLKGSYSQLPEACGIVFSEIQKHDVKVANNWYLEHYLNDPTTTPESELLTEILIPVS